MIVIGVLVVGFAVLAYFKWLRPEGPVSAAQETIQEYFDALCGGNTSAVEALHAPGMEPSSDEVQAYSMACQTVKMSVDKLEVVTLSETSDEMEVEIKNYELTMSAFGQTETISMSEFQEQLGTSEGTKLKLRKVDGVWKLNQSAVLSPLEAMVPTSVPCTIDGGG